MKYKINPKVPAYTLPLKPGDIYNFSKIKSQLSSKDSQNLLLKNGVATMDWGKNDDVVQAYEAIKKMDVPVFVTSDSLLHLYHIQFDETLKRIEQKEFYPDLIKISEAMQQEMLDRYGAGPDSVKKSYLEGAAYFSVGLKLLKPDAKVPSEVKLYVDWEVDHIEKHAGFPDEARRRRIRFSPIWRITRNMSRAGITPRARS